MKTVRSLIITLFLLLPVPLFAAQPLITDDAGTQGIGKFQLELSGANSRKSDDGVIEHHTLGAVVLTYGAANALDLAVGVLWGKNDVDEGGLTSTASGFGDVGLSAKWRFYEHEGLNLALRPGITLPTGDYNKGFSNGRATESFFLIATREIGPHAVHANLGYLRNENRGQDRMDIWHASLAAEYLAAKALRLVADIGTETNPERTSKINPAYVLAGAVYAVTGSIDIDAGLKFGLNAEEQAFTVLSGITVHW